MTQTFEAQLVTLIERGDLSLRDNVDGYMHDHLAGHKGAARTRTQAATERERVASYVEMNGPDSDVCRAVVECIRNPGIAPGGMEKVSG